MPCARRHSCPHCLCVNYKAMQSAQLLSGFHRQVTRVVQDAHALRSQACVCYSKTRCQATQRSAAESVTRLHTQSRTRMSCNKMS